MVIVLFVLILCLTIFLVKDACLFVLYLDLFLSCGVKLSLPVIGAGVIIYMSLSIPFPFWVAAK